MRWAKSFLKTNLPLFSVERILRCFKANLHVMIFGPLTGSINREMGGAVALWLVHQNPDRTVWVPGGVLRLVNDGDDQRIFLGLKFSIPGCFWVGKFDKYFFG